MKYTVNDLSTEEKLKLLSGRPDNWHTEDLGGKLTSVFMSDGPLGLRTPEYDDKGNEIGDTPAVAYPSGEVLSQTWMPELAYEMGRALGDDCIEKNVDVLLGPGVNIKREPLCGRNFEYFSEDPYISGVFGREYIRGLQEKHISATLKHYCCNNLEYGRRWVSSEVDERTLREIYIRPFEIAMEAEPWAVMSSYNRVNGIKLSEHKELNSLLRETLGFDGIIMSDWCAVDDHTASVRSGLDLEMPYNEEHLKQLTEDYENGRITDSEIDICVERLLRFIEKIENERTMRRIESTREQRLALSQRIAEEGIVLLKNNGVLPLKDGETVSISGGCASIYMSGAGSSRVKPLTEPSKLKDELEKIFTASRFSHDPRYELVGNWDCVPDEAIGKDVALVCVGAEDSEGSERPDNPSVVPAGNGMKLPRVSEELIIRTARLNPNTVVILYCGAAVDMSAWIDKVAAVVFVGYGGERVHNALAKILTGRINPSGKLTESFPLCEDTASAAGCYRDSFVNVYSEGLLVGYRWSDMQRFTDKPSGVLFPFGYGMSYSKYAYSDLKIESDGENVRVKFLISNTEGDGGKETAELYVHEMRSYVFRPVKELKGFKKVYVERGAVTEVEIELPRSAFAHYSVNTHEWTLTAGDFEILVGASSEDIRLRGIVNIS